MNELAIDRLESPIGSLTIAVHDGTLCALDYREEAVVLEQLRGRFGSIPSRERDDPAGHSSRLAAYFAGRLDALDDLPVDPAGTPFQRRVWKALCEIPCGETRSYGDVARAVGNAGAVRAVGGANGRNPIAIVIPCHRVVNANGRIGGYGGGLERKRWLLAHEGALLLE